MANVPNLRFKEYTDNYVSSKLNNHCKIITRNNEKKYEYPVMMISAGNGFIFQSEKYSRDNAGSSLDKYILLYKGELAYNRGNSKQFPYGAIYEMKEQRALIPYVYHCFKINEDESTRYYSYYLNSAFKNEQLSKIITSSVRGNGLLNISKSDFFNLNIVVPSIAEQKKIACFLDLIEARIETQIKIIEGMDSLKQSISIKLFDQLESTVKLCDVCSITKGKQINGSELLEKGQYYMMNGGTEPSGYLNDFNTIEGTISISEGGNSCGYVQYNKEKFWSGGHCYTLKNLSNLIDTKYLYFFLKAKEKDVMALRIGTGLPNIQKKDIESFLIPVPNMEFQNDIVKVLESISLKIDVLKRQLEYYKQQKQYLLSNLFI